MPGLEIKWESRKEGGNGSERAECADVEWWLGRGYVQ